MRAHNHLYEPVEAKNMSILSNVKCCPRCSSQKLDLQKTPFISAGEEVGIVYDDSKTGCYDWQHVVVGIECDSGHIFWIES